MSNAQEILNSLDAAEIRKRLEEIDHERDALLVLHRAAIRLERGKQKSASLALSNSPTAAGQEGSP